MESFIMQAEIFYNEKAPGELSLHIPARLSRNGYREAGLRAPELLHAACLISKQIISHIARFVKNIEGEAIIDEANAAAS